MSKLQERVPALQTRSERLEMTTSVLDDVLEDGRIEKVDLVLAVRERLESERVNEAIILEEARKGIAEQLVSGWANAATITFDRNQRVPVYQTQLGFANSYFKVGSTFVRPDVMTEDDFDTMLNRIDKRIANAQTDRAIIADFADRARPGLQAGLNLVQQFEAGTLELFAANPDDEDKALEEGDEEA